MTITPQNEGPFFGRLPQDTRPIIYNYFDSADLATFRAVSGIFSQTIGMNQEIAQKILWVTRFCPQGMSSDFDKALRAYGRTCARLDICVPGCRAVNDLGFMLNAYKAGIESLTEKACSEQGVVYSYSHKRALEDASKREMMLKGSDIEGLFSYFPNLRTLNLRGVQVSTSFDLSKMKSLRTLYLPENTTVDLLQTLIPQHLPIKKLVIPKHALLYSNDHLQFISSCPNLQNLALPNVTTNQALETLSSLPIAKKLKSIDLSRSDISDNGFIQLISACYSSLTHVYASNTSIGDESIQMLSTLCPNLRTLLIEHTHITDETVKMLPSFKKLEKLNFFVPVGQVSHDLVRQILPQLAPTLTTLRFNANDDCLQAIGKAKMQLKYLFLEGSYVSGEGMDALAQAKIPLQVLSLEERIFDAFKPAISLKTLESFPLRYLFLDLLKTDIKPSAKLLKLCKSTLMQMEKQPSNMDWLYRQFVPIRYHTGIGHWKEEYLKLL